MQKIWLWIAIAATLAIRLWFTVVRRIDSDEPQHLHVAWAWTQGLVQYRDVFDNHLPLLHMLYAPVMALMPESSTVFLFMRLAILPFAVACAWLVYVAARPLYGAWTATVAALTFSVLPPWLAKSAEFRNDTLWIFFWLAALALVVRRRWFWAGVAMGLCFLASIKTVPLVLAHLLAYATFPSGATGSQPVDRGGRAGPSLQILAGGALPPLIVFAVMAAFGALDDLFYANLFFNAAAPVSAARRIAGLIGFAIVGPSIVYFGRKVRDRYEYATMHLILFSCWFIAVMLAFWPILTSRDFLPLAPPAALAIAYWSAGVPRRRSVALILALATIASAIDARIWRIHEPTRHQFVDAAVQLTAPNDYVLDLKGDAVFRRRATRYIYEDVGRALTEQGLLADEGPEEIIEKGCCAAMADSTHLPPRTRDFLNRYFVGPGSIRVCGTNVQGNEFEIAVPQTYAVVSASSSPVLLDGKPYDGPRYLEAGRHTLSGADSATVIWARALAKPEAAPELRAMISGVAGPAVAARQTPSSSRRE
ncbi:MAG TPA: glycosyltransferase family 39 protein [Thermoanaerobaculia bacterium]|nr:glycosyltransferase family 39 protein [Thermoanaerobaculia bacterium]